MNVRRRTFFHDNEKAAEKGGVRTANDSASQKFVTVRRIFSSGPAEKTQACVPNFGGLPFLCKRLPGLVCRYSCVPRLYQAIQFVCAYASTFHVPCQPLKERLVLYTNIALDCSNFYGRLYPHMTDCCLSKEEGVLKHTVKSSLSEGISGRLSTGRI